MGQIDGKLRQMDLDVNLTERFDADFNLTGCDEDVKLTSNG